MARKRPRNSSRRVAKAGNLTDCLGLILLPTQVQRLWRRYFVWETFLKERENQMHINKMESKLTSFLRGLSGVGYRWESGCALERIDDDPCLSFNQSVCYFGATCQTWSATTWVRRDSNSGITPSREPGVSSLDVR